MAALSLLEKGVDSQSRSLFHPGNPIASIGLDRRDPFPRLALHSRGLLADLGTQGFGLLLRLRLHLLCHEVLICGSLRHFCRFRGGNGADSLCIAIGLHTKVLSSGRRSP
ncbi:MAG: hypothetical protein M3256_24565 [Actinomycetota bacterium]|nr:hypothetical protein [Actinomycetota bacterium]